MTSPGQGYFKEETLNQVACNIPWHDALHITEKSDSANICCKTLWNIRNIVVDHTLDAILRERIIYKLAKVFTVNTDNQRIDSVTVNPLCGACLWCTEHITLYLLSCFSFL